MTILSGCPLCGVASGGEDPRTLVWRDEYCVGAVALHQKVATLGSVLLLPVEHYENIYSLPDDIGEHLFGVTKRLAHALKRALSCDGVTIRQNNERAGGQDVMHYHIHITPRYTGDDRGMAGWQASPVAQRIQLAEQIRAATTAT